jgi:hypothetical protein
MQMERFSPSHAVGVGPQVAVLDAENEIIYARLGYTEVERRAEDGYRRQARVSAAPRVGGSGPLGRLEAVKKLLQAVNQAANLVVESSGQDCVYGRGRRVFTLEVTAFGCSDTEGLAGTGDGQHGGGAAR